MPDRNKNTDSEITQIAADLKYLRQDVSEIKETIVKKVDTLWDVYQQQKGSAIALRLMTGAVGGLIATILEVWVYNRHG